MKKLLSILLILAAYTGYAQIKVIKVQGIPAPIDTQHLRSDINKKLNIVDAFTKSNADALYRPITYVPTWAEISGKPAVIFVSDTALMLSPYATKAKLKADSTTLANAITAASGGGVLSFNGRVGAVILTQSDISAFAYTKAETDGFINGKANVTHTHTASQITDFQTQVSANTNVIANTAKRSYPSGDETKLAGIASGATANSTDANLRDRSTHTGTQAATTIVESATKRFVTDTEKATWNSKLSAADISGLTPITKTQADSTALRTEINTKVSTSVANATYATIANLGLKANDNEVVKLSGTQTITGTKTYNNAFQVHASTNVYWGSGLTYGVMTYDIGKAIIGGMSGKILQLNSGGNPALTLQLDGSGTFRGAVSSQIALDSSYNPILGQLYPSGKRWVLFGDSFSSNIVSTSAYPYYVIDKIKFKNTVTNAVPGNKISQQSAKLDSILTANPTYFNSFDIVSIFIGINDFANPQGYPLGTYTDAAGTITYAGYLKHMIEAILTAKPNIELYVITPPEGNGAGVTYKATNSAGWTVQQMSALISKICLDYSVQCIDLYNYSQFNLKTLPTLTVEGLHPNAVGGKFIGNMIASAFINRTNSGKYIPSFSDVTGVASLDQLPETDFPVKAPLEVDVNGNLGIRDTFATKSNPFFTGVAKIDADTLATRAYARSVGGSGSGGMVSLENRNYANDSLAVTVGGLSLWDYYRTGSDVKVVSKLPAVNTTDFNFQIEVKSGYSDTVSIRMDSYSAGQSFNVTANWGDGTTTNYTGGFDYTMNHKYLSTGVYNPTFVVSNYANVKEIYFRPTLDTLNLKNINNVLKFNTLALFQISKGKFQAISDTITLPATVKTYGIIDCDIVNFNPSTLPNITKFVLRTGPLIFAPTILPATLNDVEILAGGAWHSAQINTFLAYMVTKTFNAGAKTLKIVQFQGAVPTGQGLTDKATLEANGWTVTTD